MIGCGLLALMGSLWTERHGGHVLVRNEREAPAT
jgi:hypothetical protein